MDFNFFIEDRLRSVAPRVNCPSIGRLSAARESMASAHDEIMADRMRGSNMAHQPPYALVVATSRLLTAIPAMIKLKMTAANSSNQPQYWLGWRIGRSSKHLPPRKTRL